MWFCTTTTAFLLPFLSSVYVFCMVRPGSKVPSWACKACTITVKMLSQVCFHHLHGYHMGGKRFQCLYFLCIHQGPILVGLAPLFMSHSPPSTGVILLMAKRCAALAFAHGIAKASISASLITFYNLSNGGGSQDDGHSNQQNWKSLG